MRALVLTIGLLAAGCSAQTPAAVSATDAVSRPSAAQPRIHRATHPDGPKVERPRRWQLM